MSKGPDAFRTISEVAEDLGLPQHVLRFWETRFTQIKPLKRGGGRRYYRPDDIDLLRGIRQLLYGEGYTIRGVQRILKEQGPRFVIGAGGGAVEDVTGLRAAANLHGESIDDDAVAGASGDEDLVEAGVPDDDDGPDLVDMLPPTPKSNRAGASRRQSVADAQRRRNADQGDDEIEILRAALAELVECKRILDQVD